MKGDLVELKNNEPHCKEHGLMTQKNVRWTCDKCEAAVTEISHITQL